MQDKQRNQVDHGIYSNSNSSKSSTLSHQIIHVNTTEISVRVGEPPLAKPREFKAAGIFEKQEDAVGRTNNKKIAVICMLSGDNVQQKTNNRLIEV